MPSPLDTMALTVYGEARGEPVEGQAAVAWVIRNRVQNPRWWGRDLGSVCLAPSQFSCWAPSDPNSKLLASPLTRVTPEYHAILDLCARVLSGEAEDPSVGADHYCVTSIAEDTDWARGRTPTVVIGNHSFYRLELAQE